MDKFDSVSKIVLDDLVEHKVFDWEKFKTHEILVHCTSENWASFVAEARAHGCKFYNDNAVDPFTDEGIKTAKRLMRLYGGAGLSDDEIIFIYDFGTLKFLVHRPDDVEIFEWG